MKKNLPAFPSVICCLMLGLRSSGVPPKILSPAPGELLLHFGKHSVEELKEFPCSWSRVCDSRSGKR